MLVRIHNVPLDPREGSEAEVEEDQFSIVSVGGGNGGEEGLNLEDCGIISYRQMYLQ